VELWEGDMALKDYIFTSESVSEGHPDKVCDQISDAILDAFIANDMKLGIADESHVNTRLGCETLATTNKIVVAGEGRASEPYMKKYGKHTIVNREAISEIARDVVRDIGYEQDGFSFHGADVEVLLHGQSPDIAMGVNAKNKGGNLGEQEGAGDQGLMFGFACRDSEEYEKNSFMPAPIYFSHKILEVLSKARRSGELKDLQPDAKSQVTVRYVDGKAVGATKVVVSTQHREANSKGKKYNSGMIKEMIAAHVQKSLPKGWMPKKAADFFVNPTGNFVVGGPDGDCGLTGRKIIVDTYGGYAPHGGGAFSGKDPTKVDRSAAYAARYLAKNVVAAGLADRCLIQVAYAIGVADPMSLYVNTEGTGKVDERKLEKVLAGLFPLRPTNIRRSLQLNKPIYRRTAAYGHFGRKPDRDGGFSWERLDLVPELKRAFGAR
jgi:S-adenosylmethionine synthetase